MPSSDMTVARCVSIRSDGNRRVYGRLLYSAWPWASALATFQAPAGSGPQRVSRGHRGARPEPMQFADRIRVWRDKGLLDKVVRPKPCIRLTAKRHIHHVPLIMMTVATVFDRGPYVQQSFQNPSRARAFRNIQNKDGMGRSGARISTHAHSRTRMSGTVWRWFPKSFFRPVDSRTCSSSSII